MNKIYFAHPVNIYNQPIEAAFEQLIALHLTNGDRNLIENPNQPHHQVGYNNRVTRMKESGLDDKPMAYFYEEVLPNCSGCVAVTFLDSRMGAGVAGEMNWFIEREFPTWNVFPVRELTREDLEWFIKNPLCGLFAVGLLSDGERKRILSNDPSYVISREETRLRTWRVYNRERRPYEEAHLVSMPVPEGFYPVG